MRLLLFVILGIMLILMIIVSIWYVSHPLRPLPKPTGLYGIGRMTYYLVDKERQAPHAQEQTPRAWNFSVWYPTDEQPCRCYPYIDHRIVAKMLQEVGAKLFWILKPLYWVYTYVQDISVMCFSKPEAVVSQAYNHYPVIFFCPGYGALPDLYASVLENVASHGFVIVGMNHSGVNGPIISPQGDLIMVRVEPEDDQGWQREIDAAAADVQATLAFLENENQNVHSIWYQKLNLACVGALGHSFGAMVPVMLCKQDQRFCAGINLDGWLGNRARNAQEPITKPFMFMVNDAQWPSTQSRMKNLHDMHLVCSSSPHACSVMVLPGSNHFTFCDLTLLRWPFNRQFRSQQDPYKLFTALNEIIIKFFAATIKAV